MLQSLLHSRTQLTNIVLKSPSPSHRGLLLPRRIKWGSSEQVVRRKETCLTSPGFPIRELQGIRHQVLYSLWLPGPSTAPHASQGNSSHLADHLLRFHLFLKSSLPLLCTLPIPIHSYRAHMKPTVWFLLVYSIQYTVYSI